ncbi:hypothetical protein JK361_26000 [Streptomyces sp. 5-8]|uniref:TetR family transcriptional regulator n=1 Tax=Streptomyces musisoli TaxID=2802280 RepID=A0ABS1P762_9ACTN|nr:hypothetical protein [Streptomyces musisoli]MBL1108000.1 hypothetical protein [Streptomyces musisoli]
MADHDNHRERLLTLMEALVGAFAYIQALLKDLPVPVIIPAFTPDDDDEEAPSRALLSLDRVRQIIQDEPISERDKRAFEHAVLDWFTAYELLVITGMAGPAPWRLDAADFAMNRIVTWIEMIEDDEQDENES